MKRAIHPNPPTPRGCDGCRLAGRDRAEEAGHDPGPDVEGQIINGQSRPVTPGQVASLEHPTSQRGATMAAATGYIIADRQPE